MDPQGVPVVIELGERDIEQAVITVTRRDDPELRSNPRDGAAEAVAGVLGEMQTGYYEEAHRRLRERTRDDITTLDQFREFFSSEETESGGFVRAPWSEDPATEETMAELGVTVRCIPFDAELLRRPLRDHRRRGEGDGDLREGVLAPGRYGGSLAGGLDHRHGGAMESSGPTQSEEFRLVLSPDLRAGWRARSALRQRFSNRLPAPTLTDLISVVSELVNNSVAHGPGKPIMVTLVTGSETIRGEVADQGNPASAIPEIQNADGRGLKLVDKLTSRWAVYEGSTPCGSSFRSAPRRV